MSAPPSGRRPGVAAPGRAAGDQPGPEGGPARRPGPAAARTGIRGGGLAQPQVWKGAFFAVAALAIVAGAAWAVLGSRFFVVRSVRVVGAAGAVTSAEVLAAARIPPGLPMLRVSDGEITRRVEQIRQVASAEVSRDWPDTVVISVRPRVPVFAVGRPGHYQLVDAFGVSVRRSARRPAGMPLLAVGAVGAPAGLAGNPAVRAASAVLDELPGSLARQVASVRASSAEDVSLRLTDGVEIIWGGVGGAAQKGRELTVLMRMHARVYDVSAPGTAVTRG